MLLFPVILCFHPDITAQNLVSNPGFEQVDPDCIEEYYEVLNPLSCSVPCATGWTVTEGLPDYFNFNYHPREDRYPEPRSGDAYVALYLPFKGEVPARSSLESIGTELLRPLAKGQRYHAEVYVAKDLKHNPASIDGIGMLFSEVPFNELVPDQGMPRLKKIRELDPQVIQPEGRKLNKSDEWMLVSGDFTASGNERYLTIGSFRFDEATLSDFAYYYFDDISVTPVGSISELLKSQDAARLKSIHFEPGSAALQEPSFDELRELAGLLEREPELRVEITGHTDDRGDAASNLQLSTDRAKAVVDYLVVLGIAADRMEYRGAGASAPLVSDDTEKGRAQNRRIEVRILNPVPDP